MGEEIALRNDTTLPFRAVTGEAFRRYTFPDGTTVSINRVRYLAVTDSGSAYLLDASGRAHYIPTGWTHLEWTVEEGAPHFSVGRRAGA